MGIQTFKYMRFLYITMDEKEQEDKGGKLKLQFIASDELWDKVLRYKINSGLKNNNLAVEKLINKALESVGDVEIFSEISGKVI